MDGFDVLRLSLFNSSNWKGSGRVRLGRASVLDAPALYGVELLRDVLLFGEGDASPRAMARAGTDKLGKSLGLTAMDRDGCELDGGSDDPKEG